MADLVKNEEVLYGVKEERNIFGKINPRKANWIGRILPWNFLLKHGIEREMEELGRLGRIHRRLLDNIKQKGRYWNFIEEALDRTFRLGKKLRTCRKTDYIMNCLQSSVIYANNLMLG